jgi:hypothetical protein
MNRSVLEKKIELHRPRAAGAEIWANFETIHSSRYIHPARKKKL